MKETAEKNKPVEKKKIIISIALIGLLTIGLILTLILFLQDGGSDSSVPTVTIEIPEKKSASDREPFSLQMRLSDLGDDLYPAVSFSIAFDASKIEFLGIDEGNVLIKNPDNTSGAELPEWSVNVEKANQNGIINIMYLDMTAGKHSFDKAYLETDNILLHLRFRLRGSVKNGDVLELSFEDAVFAASDEEKSLASNKGTLKTENGRIVIGE